MFTNGLSFWSETVPDCTPNIGFFISDLKLSSMSDVFNGVDGRGHVPGMLDADDLAHVSDGGHVDDFSKSSFESTFYAGQVKLVAEPKSCLNLEDK